MGQPGTAYVNTALLFRFMTAAVGVSRSHEVATRTFRTVVNVALEATAPKTNG